MSCHGGTRETQRASEYTIALAGNPNVGKSVLFSKLTGLQVAVANYPGKTVELNVGFRKTGGPTVKVIDLPGCYSLSPFSEDQAVAAQALREQKPDLIVAVVDSSNLARNLYLVLELAENGSPVLIVLNMVDCAAKKGLRVDHGKLSELTGFPVVPTVATKGVGLDDLNRAIQRELTEPALHGTRDTFVHSPFRTEPGISTGGDSARARHFRAEQIAKAVTVETRDQVATFAEKMKYYSIRPATGIPMLAATLLGMFWFMSYVGSILSDALTWSWTIFVSPALRAGTMWVTGGQAVLSKIVLWGVDAGILSALGVGIPYVLTFYIVLSVLEDTGYLNSLAFITDTVMKRFGLHGRAIIPLLSGAGCNVPAIMATRVLQTRRERIIASTLITLVPCSARIAVILGVVGVLVGWIYAGWIFAVDMAVVGIVGFALGRLLPGDSSGFVMEVFPFRMPDAVTVLRKTWLRFKGFMLHALPIVTIGSLALGALYETGLVWVLVKPTAPLIEGFLGLPVIAGICLLLGILRKELTIQLLMALAIVQYGPATSSLLSFMTPLQMFVFALVVTLYFPCIATASAMGKEIGWAATLLVMALTVGLAILVGGLAFRVIPFLGGF